jgi:Multiubiquitin
MSKPEQKFKIMIDQKPFEVEEQFITGVQIKAIVGAPANYGVWLKVNGPDPDKEIADNEQVDLAQPGREHFFTGAKTTTEG